jgi:hypothetical protein
MERLAEVSITVLPSDFDFPNRDLGIFFWDLSANPLSNTDVQQQTQRGNGPWVRGQYGFEFEMPINKLVGCGSLCHATSYKDPTPQDETKSSFVKPAGW